MPWKSPSLRFVILSPVAGIYSSLRSIADRAFELPYLRLDPRGRLLAPYPPRPLDVFAPRGERGFGRRVLAEMREQPKPRVPRARPARHLVMPKLVRRRVAADDPTHLVPFHRSAFRSFCIHDRRIAHLSQCVNVEPPHACLWCWRGEAVVSDCMSAWAAGPRNRFLGAWVKRLPIKPAFPSRIGGPWRTNTKTDTNTDTGQSTAIPTGR